MLDIAIRRPWWGCPRAWRGALMLGFLLWSFSYAGLRATHGIVHLTGTYFTEIKTSTGVTQTWAGHVVNPSREAPLWRKRLYLFLYTPAMVTEEIAWDLLRPKTPQTFRYSYQDGVVQ